MNRTFCILLTCFFFSVGANRAIAQDQDSIPAQNPTTVKLIERILGTWQISAVYADGKNVTTPDSLNDLTIDFNTDGKYVRRSGNTVVFNDSYRVNEAQGILYMEYPGDRSPDEWYISFKDGDLIMKRRGIPRLSKYAFVYNRIEQGSRKLDD